MPTSVAPHKRQLHISGGPSRNGDVTRTSRARTCGSRRQIIVISHNPKLVMNFDAEQVLIASAEKRTNGLPVIS